MRTRQAVSALNGLGPEELGEVVVQVLERLAAAARTQTAAVDGVLVGLLDATVGRLGGQVLGGGLSDEALVGSVEALQEACTRVDAERLRRIGELDARKAYRGRAMSTADWLAPRLGLSRGQAKADTETAAALERLPATAQRVRRGQLGVGQARQAARGLGELDRLAEAGEAVAADAAARLDELVASSEPKATAGQVRRRVEEHLGEQAPGALDARERRAHARRHAWIARRGDGYAFEGNLGAAAGAHLAAAVEALARRAGEQDTRTRGQRVADAFARLGEQALDAGGLPEVAAQRPHVILTGTRAGVDGQAGAPVCVLDGFGPVGSATARMLACDGQVTEVVVDADGRPLQVKETGRPTRAQRRAVIARDGGCVGCGAPASRCQLHHVVWRRRGGATVVGNLVLVCFVCHHAVHHDGWVLTRDTHGRWRAHPPDPDAPSPGARGHPAGADPPTPAEPRLAV